MILDVVIPAYADTRKMILDVVIPAYAGTQKPPRWMPVSPA